MTTTDTRTLALGTMSYGTRVDAPTAFALLDRYVERGGRWLDTADNYACWLSPSGRGGTSEATLGAWFRAHPGVRDQVRISTKLGADPVTPGVWPASWEGLSPTAIDRAIGHSLDRLGTDHVDLLWAHVEDRAVDLAAQVSALGALVSSGRAGRIGASNHATWRVERARTLARTAAVPSFTALQLRHTYLQPIPFAPLPDTGHVVASPEALDYAATEGLDLWSYTTLLGGAFTHPDRLQDAYRHPDTERRLATLARVAQRYGATSNQVVLAWLLDGSPRVTPIIGPSTLAQLDEAMDARDLHLDEDARAELDEGGTA